MKSKITAAISAIVVLMTGAAAAVINTQTLSLGNSITLDETNAASTSDVQVEQSAALTSNGAQTSLAEIVNPVSPVQPVPAVTVTVTPAPVVTKLATPKVVVSTVKPQATSGGSSYSDDDKYEIEEEDDFDDDESDENDDDNDSDEGDDD